MKMTVLAGSADADLFGSSYEMNAKLAALEISQYVPIDQTILGDQLHCGLMVLSMEDEVKRAGFPYNEATRAKNILFGPVFGISDTVSSTHYRADASISGSLAFRQTEQSTTVYLANPITENASSGFAGVLISDVALKRHFADAFELGVGIQSIWLFNVANVRAMRPLDWQPRASEPGLVTYAGIYLSVEKSF